jgi:phosphotransferase system HPr (HPr) family protein
VDAEAFDDMMIPPSAERSVVLANPMGLHARPATLFVQAANSFQSRIRVRKDAQVVDGKSIMEILTLAAEQGTPLIVEADGPDAEQAVEALANLLNQDLGED